MPCVVMRRSISLLNADVNGKMSYNFTQKETERELLPVVHFPDGHTGRGQELARIPPRSPLWVGGSECLGPALLLEALQPGLTAALQHGMLAPQAAAWSSAPQHLLLSLSFRHRSS